MSATALYFPFTYVFSDVLTEVYGFAKARTVLWQVLCASVFAGMLYQVVVLLPSAPGVAGAEAYAQVLGSVPRILVGGWIAVFVGAYINDLVMAKMKVATRGKYFSLRAFTSTLAGEGANTALFYIIALFGVIPHSVLITSILSGWFLKVAVETVMLPVTYIIVKKIKRIENEDFDDSETDFSPLPLGTSLLTPQARS